MINSFSGMAVGFTFIGLAGTAFYQHGSGAILNPAVALAHLAVNASTSGLNDIWVYLVRGNKLCLAPTPRPDLT